MNREFIISDDQKRRLNILKMLFALFVIFIHNDLSDIKFSDQLFVIEVPIWYEYFIYLISEVIPRCAVHGFFLMSSILLYRKEFEWKNNIKKKFQTLLTPYFIMNTIWVFVFFLFQSNQKTAVFFGNDDNIIRNLNIIGWLNIYGISAKFPLLYPLWFLRNLFIFNLLAIVIKRFIDKFPRLVFSLTLVVYLFVPAFKGGVCRNSAYLHVAFWLLHSKI